MKIHPYVFVSLCLLPGLGQAADVAPKPANSIVTAPHVRAITQAPGVPEVSGEQAMVALFSLAPLMQEFETTVKPLGNYYQPFTQWSTKTRQDLLALIEAAKLSKTPGETVLLSNKAKPQFEKAIKIAKAIVPLDPEVQFLNNQIAKASACLAKRQAALQMADEKSKLAVQFAMDGLPASVKSLMSLVTEANAACS